MIKSTFVVRLALFAIGSLAACGGSAPPVTTAGGPSGGGGGTTASGGGGDTIDAQVAQGKALYAESCASCHGAAGEGKGAPAVVGKNALPLDPPAGAKKRQSQFKTAADVFAFTKKTMPPGGAGSLKDAEYWAILAFDLKASGVALDKKLDDSNAASTNLR